MKSIFVINHTNSHALFYDLSSHNDERAKPFIYFREAIEQAGFAFHPTFDAAGCHEAAAILSFGRFNLPLLEHLSLLPLHRRFLCAMEPPILVPLLYDPRIKEFFGTIFTLSDDHVDNKTYVKFTHQQARERILPPRNFDEKKLCVMIQSNFQAGHPSELYSERKRLAQFFAHSDHFDLFGSGWEGFANSRGPWRQDKQELLSRYKFMICYENMRWQRGLISERIFEAFYSSTVPVYWGADNIEETVPKECFIDRRQFSSNEELLHFLTSIDASTYNRYLEAARAYLGSPRAQKDYSPRSFGNTLLSTILERI